MLYTRLALPVAVCIAFEVDTHGWPSYLILTLTLTLILLTLATSDGDLPENKTIRCDSVSNSIRFDSVQSSAHIFSAGR